jgi:hypothetical protein
VKLSDASRAWERWRGHQRLQRNLVSWTSSAAVAVAVVALAAWGGFAPLFNVGEKGEAIAVKLGNPDGEDLPLSVSAVPDQAMQAVMSAQRDSALNTVEETRVSEPDPDPSPQAVPAKPQAKPAKPSPVKPQPVKPTTKPQPTNPPSDKPAVTEKVIRGNEKGNSSELVLKPQGDKISQNAYWPVYLFMPLPARLDAGLLARVKATNLYTAEERRDLLLQFYSKGDGLVLQGQPPLGVRPVIWEILEGAGYDVANADYKKGGTLKPVVITFRLGVPKGNADNPDLLDVRLDQSSGSGPVDEAVLYAFQKSTFANGTGLVAQGRYTYDFAAKR